MDCGLTAGESRAATGFPPAPSTGTGWLWEGEGLGRVAQWLCILGGTLDPQKHKEGVFTVLKSAASSVLF